MQPISGSSVVSQSGTSDDDLGKKKEKVETVAPKAKQGNILLVSDSLLHKLDVKRFFVKGQKTVKLSRSGDTAKIVGHRALEYIDKKNGETFQAVVLLGGTNDISKKKADIESAAKELTETAEILSSAEARVTNSNNYPILRREPLPDATPNMATIRGYVDSKIHLF